MIISHSHKFIFIATPKTGTTSIQKALQNLASEKSDTVVEKSKDGKHLTALAIKENIPPTKWDTYFKFGFVRNPFDWIASWYNFRSRQELGDPNHPDHHRWTGKMTFEDFVVNEAVHGKSPGDWVTDQKGQIIVDFVGRYENLGNHFDYICQRIGLPQIQLPSLNISKKAINPKKLYTLKAWKTAENRFKRDLDLFSYTKELQYNHRKGRSFWRFIKDNIRQKLPFSINNLQQNMKMKSER